MYNSDIHIFIGVIFGHHLGDVQENVISNIMRLQFYSHSLNTLHDVYDFVIATH